MEADASKAGRRHHLVPRFHLRHFADGDEQLIGVRRPSAVAVPMSVSNAAVRCGFYDVPTPDGPSGVVEDALAQIEGLAAGIITRVLEHGLGAMTVPDRYEMSVFMAMQTVRGVDFTQSAQGLLAETERLVAESSSPDAHAKVARLFGIDPQEVPEAELVHGVDLEGAPPPPEWWVRTASLAAAEDLGAFFFVRRWGTLQLPSPSFITSDRPLVMFRAGSGDGEPTGFKNADAILMPVSRDLAFVLERDDFNLSDCVSDLDSAVALVNAVVAASSYEWVFHHPADQPSELLNLPPAPPAARAEQVTYERRGDKVHARSRIIPNLPTPPLGWEFSG